MVCFNKKSKCIRENNGSVMLTVLIAFFFISILIAIIMPLVVLNYRMKAVERRAKNEFYYVEKSLNDIYSGIGKECATELGTVYSSTLANSYEFTDDTKAYNEFCKNYVKALIMDFYKDEYGNRINLKEKFKNYLTSGAVANATINNIVDDSDVSTYITVEFYKRDGSTPNSPNLADETEYKDIKEIVIKNIYVSSLDTSEIKSSITTDIVIEIPEISFFKINENELDYALVGCKGLVFNGNADVTGNAYGGVDKNDKLSSGADNPEYCKGGIKIVKAGSSGGDVTFKSNYVVSAGDVALNDGTLKIEKGHSTNDNEIWLENIVIGDKDKTKDKTATLEINGSTYALNDLQVEGKDKTVKLFGNYYGYGKEDVTLASRESELKPEKNKYDSEPDYYTYYDSKVRSQSSSIIVNATDSLVNLNGLDNLVVLGQAYIDHNSKFDINDSNNTPRVSNVTESKLSMDGTGMSGTMKASQEILLCPEEFLLNSNPYSITSSKPDFTVDKNKLTTWLLDNFGSAVELKTEPTRTVKIKRGSSIYGYCYLNFKDDDSRNLYIEKIMNCDLTQKSSDNEPTLQSLNRRVVAALESQNSEMKTASIPNVYTQNGGVVAFDYDTNLSDAGRYSEYKENDVAIKNNKNNSAGYDNMVTKSNQKFQDLSTFLDFNSEFLKTINTSDFSDADYPFGRLWWINGIKDDAQTEPKTMNYGGCLTVINGESQPINISSVISGAPVDSDGYSDLVIISLSDVIIDADVKIKGFIFSNGKVIVQDGKKLEIKSDLSVVQKRISEEISDIKSSIPVGATNNEIDAAYKAGYITRYLLRTDFDSSTGKLDKKCNKSKIDVIGSRRYNISTKETTNTSMVVNSDYTAFVSFENWRKTGAGN